MNLTRRDRITEGIRRLEGSHRDLEKPIYVGEAGFSPSLEWVHILGMSRFWENVALGFGDLESRHERFLTGLYRAGLPLIFLTIGEPSTLSFYLGLPRVNGNASSWPTMLSAAFPGCETLLNSPPRGMLQAMAESGYIAKMTGNPSMPVEQIATHAPQQPQYPSARLESVLRAMQGSVWAYLVMAEPVAENAVEATFQHLGNEEQEIVSAFLRRGSAEENNNPEAKHYVDLLRAARAKHQLGKQQGMWEVQSYLLSESSLDLSRGMLALTSAFSGAHSQPEPIRVRECTRTDRLSREYKATTRLTTSETAVLARLPGSEFPGYRLHDLIRFAVSPIPFSHAKRVAVGIILDHGFKTENWFEIGVDDFCKHVFVAGVPGSGKSQTCQFLLRQLWEEQAVPWLVLEPSSKSEYRRLIASPLGADLRIFTLGDETGVPFRLNPFEVQPGVHVQTHIDGLLALFNAAFALYPPMPYVLSLAVHRTYTSFGWDLVSGQHSDGYGPEVRPTLSDLSDMIGRIVGELGYDREISGNVRAGLQTRLSILIQGGKGLMLNSCESVPMDYLLSKPTILELSAVGDDEEKAFILGALLLRLTEHRQAMGLSNGKLRHVTVVEEAHRLLRAVPETVGTEVANPRGKAVETFCNLLAEVRAFGEGILAVDQIPAKLSPDIVKNTNLKIVHRLVAKDDRQLVGGSMNLSESQERYLSTLAPGQAVVYAEGREAAYLVSVPDHARNHPYGTANPTKKEIVEHMRERLPVLPETRRTRRPESGPSALPLPLPDCPGCPEGTCDKHATILQHLLTVDHSIEFGAALAGSWEDLWNLGTDIAHEIWQNQAAPVEAPYCLLMNIAAVSGFDKEETAAMCRNLSILRDRAKGEKQ